MKYFLSRYISPILWKYIKKSKRYEIFKEMQKLQWNTLEENLELQKEKLYEILDYSIKNVPYYKKISQEKDIKINRDNVFQDIKKFPVLTKDVLRNNFKDLINPGVRAKKNTSGGSTGEQAIFMQDKKMYDYNAATKILFDEWAGRKKGELLVKLWGSERDILENTMGFKGFLVRNFSNEVLLNTYKMSENNMAEYINVINNLKPKMILAYATSAFEISRFIVEKKINVHSPKAVMTSAGMLFPHFRDIIEKAFRCPVFNRYGSREVGDIACECEKHSGLHINILTQYLEVLDENLNEAASGNAGDIYVTYLHNYAMPLIRYKIGDRGSVSETGCSCNRGLPLIKEIQGRVGCILRTKNGAVDSTALTTSFYFYPSIKKYQVIQKGDNFTIKVVIDKSDSWNDDKRNLEIKLKKIFGESASFQFEIVDEIPSSKSGKYLFFINENEFKQ